MYGKTSTAILLFALVACGGDSSGDSTTATASEGGSSSTDASGTLDGSTTTSSSTSADSGSSTSGVDESSTGASADSSSTADGSSSESTGMVEFTLTSDAFTEGGGIPGIHHASGGNESPPLDWVGEPAGTMSFAIFFHDMTINYNHSAIWDIPADVYSLPQDVDQDAMPADVPGAVQCMSWLDQYGYGGPGSASNFYTFTLYAIDVASIPEIDESSSLGQVRMAFEMHSLGSTTLTGQSTGP